MSILYSYFRDGNAATLIVKVSIYRSQLTGNSRERLYAIIITYL